MYAEIRGIQKSFNIMLRNTGKYCHITSPYFLPPKSIRDALINAKQRGVDVKVITQGLCRTPLISLASRHIYGLFLKKGIQIYQMYNQELHAKTASIDGLFCTVGSFNLDDLSYKYLLEVSITILDQDISKQMNEQFKIDLSNSVELTLENWESRSIWLKIYHWLAYQLCRLLCL